MLPNRYGTVKGRKHTFRRARRELRWKRYKFFHGKQIWQGWTPVTGRIWTITSSAALPPLPGCGALPTLALLREHIEFGGRHPLRPIPSDAFADPDAWKDPGAIAAPVSPAPKNFIPDASDPTGTTGKSYSRIVRDFVDAKIVKRVPKKTYEYVYVVSTLPSEQVIHDPEVLRQKAADTAARSQARQAKRAKPFTGKDDPRWQKAQATLRARREAKQAAQAALDAETVPYEDSRLRLEGGKVVGRKRRRSRRS